MSVTPTDFHEVKCVTGYQNIAANYPDFLLDESKLRAKPFDYLFFPKNEVELASVLVEMNRLRIPVTLAGARTGLVGGSVPYSGAVISLERFDKIESVHYEPDSQEWRITAQCAVNLKTLQDFLVARHNPNLDQVSESSNRQSFYNFQNDPVRYFYPPDPTEMSASLGGTVATNASGASTFRFGPTRAWIRRLRVMLVNGELLDIPRGKYFSSQEGKFTIIDSSGKTIHFSIPRYTMPKTKNASGLYSHPGMDLIDLFIGSEGLLGVVTQVEVALHPRNNKLAMIQFLDLEEQAVNLTIGFRTVPQLQLDFIEFYSETTLNLLKNLQNGPSQTDLPQIPPTARAALFFELDYDPEKDDISLGVLEEVITRCGGDMANSWVGFEERDLDKFKHFRHLVPETINRIISERKRIEPAIHKFSTDLAVPDNHLEDIWSLYRTECERSGLEWYAFGHIGDNHIHVNILPRSGQDMITAQELFRKFAQRAVEWGGTVSAEHGIGKIKQGYLQMMYSAEEIDQIRRVKAALDPNLILNRGNMFPVEG